jgi:dipeptide transport system ATP-binding protein
MALLEIQNLSVEFKTSSGAFRAVDHVSMQVDVGEVLAIVGESGSGKSVAMLAVMGLLPWTATVTADIVNFDGRDLLNITPEVRRKITGKDMAMIFQEPMTSLNPCFTVGYQQLSGGMSQRVMIAMALACNPKLLIADEPTTALDVTIQAQILELLTSLQKDKGMGLVLITHSMGVVAETAERVSVQYAGQKVEEQPVAGLFASPRHPYTSALLSALPERATGRKLPSIQGVVPGQFDRPKGCLFAPRCDFATDLCRITPPSMNDGALCHYPLGAPK